VTRRILVTLALVALAATLGVGPAEAVDPITQIADQPAATLLLPYFEVDLDDPSGTTTLFSINNASATAVLAHVVVWSDLAVPVLAFNVYLTGYDVQQINMRDVLRGRLPRTASAGQDPGDAITPQGDFSQDINFASCTGQLPYPADINLLQPGLVAHLRAALTGQPSALLEDKCAGRSLGDGRARGYLTVDTVNNCTLRVPGFPGYFFGGGQGDATNQNVLWGDFVQQTGSGRQGRGAFSDNLVHILAAPGASSVSGYPINPQTAAGTGQYTFYTRFGTGEDNRQPLATQFAARYVNETVGRLRHDTAVVVWRDPKVAQEAFACDTPPTWYPLGQEKILAFDEEERPTAITGNPFPAATQLVTVGGPDLPVPADAGWLYLNLNTAVADAPGVPGEDPNAAQAWVVVARDRGGPLGRGYRAVPLDSATDTTNSHQDPDE
jgi:hypothetical protein